MTPSSAARPAIASLSGAPAPAPRHRTLVDALEAAARDDAPLFVFHGGGEPRPCGGRALRDRAAKWAACIARAGARPGDRVLLLVGAGPEFVGAFLGASLGGFVPVPLATPLTFGGVERHLANLAAIAESARPSVVVASPRLAEALARVPALRERVPAVVTPQDAAAAGIVHVPLPSIDARSTAFLQYTSGTTGRPKGVVVSHGALVANAGAIAAALDLRDDDVGVSWLPPFHDMGLVGALLTTVVHPYTVHVLPPERFVMRPGAWLALLSNVRATVSAAPNFAYALCTAKAEPDDDVRLGAWRAALDGAEPVCADTLERFARRFAAHGMRRDAFLPVYGLAESTLAVAFAERGRAFEVTTADRDALAAGRVVAHADGATLVSVGTPVAGTHVRVRRDGRIASVDEVGELEVRGPSLMDGYFRDDDASAAALVDGWLRTGDLGFVRDGRLYVSGRAKDMVVVAGRNVYPTDVEGVAASVPGLGGGVAAFGRFDATSGTEKLVVAVEARAADGAVRERLASQVRGELLAVLGLPAEVRVVGVGTLPRTTSGKIRRHACAEALAR